MWRILAARAQQKFRTSDYPLREPVLPPRFRGKPVVNAGPVEGAAGIAAACPAGALAAGADGRLRLDLGRCIFCGDCEKASAGQGVKFTHEYRLAANRRDDLVLAGGEAKLADALNREAARLFGRSLKLRQVSAGGCNACEADTNVLNTPVFDLARFGIQFVASPRHADGLLITGPVTKNMELALRKTYDAVPAPKIVIAVGACAISGGIYRGHDETKSGAGDLVPVDLFIPGCPPNPWTILDGLLRFLGRLPAHPR
jgi:Ni,Fe-hydrogenase III small subunit